MEFLDGASLAQRMDAGDLTATETRRVLRQICSALEAAHRAGIIHRDLKPENVWIATPAHEDSYAKVLDFGIAKLLDNPAGKSTQTGAAMGTPRYMAPEQCMGRAVDPRADIYSMGIILYEMFAGEVPFRGETFGELIYQQMSEIARAALQAPADGTGAGAPHPDVPGEGSGQAAGVGEGALAAAGG